MPRHTLLAEVAQAQRKPMEFMLPLTRLVRMRVGPRGVRRLEQTLTAWAGPVAVTKVEVLDVHRRVARVRLTPSSADPTPR